ncbi:MAG TPA: sigma-54 dependent transcriptional regulator [Polyangiaceae bacterium]
MTDAPPMVLLVDDDAAVAKVLSALLHQEGIHAEAVRSGNEALDFLETRAVDVVLSDLRMPGMDGMQLLDRIVARWPEVPVIMLTAHGTVPLAVEAMKRGASEFLQKPFDREEVLFVVKKALAAASCLADDAPRGDGGGSDLLGGSAAMREVSALIDRAARGTATVLIRGESGTGKEIVARAIHERSSRKSNALVKLHCAALPETLLESELFGYEKGAFTGAVARKPGRIELAHHGTLFLDEIGDLPLAMQVKLLRVLQEREFERIGGTKTIRVDVRFVAATHRDLETMVKKGEFREDLFYRLSVVPLAIPPLRDRREDIEPLARHFVAVYRRANDQPTLQLSPPAIDILRDQAWPGNVRQLQNFVERLLVLSDGPTIDAADVRRELGREAALARGSRSAGEANLDAKRREAEKEAIRTALERAGDNRTVAARLLGVSRRTLYNKLDEYELIQKA